MDADRAVQKAQDDPYLAAAGGLGGSTGGGDDPYVKAAAKYGGRADTVEQPERTALEYAKHLGGLAVRMGTEGIVGGTAGVFIDPWTRLARDLYAEFGPKTITDLVAPGKKFPTITEKTTELLDRWGVAKPETPAEEISSAGGRAIAGAGGMLGLTKLIAATPELAAQFFMRGATPEAAGVTQVPRVYNPALTTPSQLPSGAVQNVPQIAAPNALVSNPLAQGIQAAIGGGAAEGVKQAGGPEWAQWAASAIAPLGATTTANVIGSVGRGARELVRPITQAGERQIAADVLGQLPVDKSAAIAKLDDYIASLEREPGAGVPGSKPTAGAVTKDYGVIGGELVASRGAANPDFAARFAENNAARLDMLARLRATKEQLLAFEKKRTAATARLRNEAYASATGPVDFRPVADKILQLAREPEGGRGNSRKALEWLANEVDLYMKDGRVSAQHADALRLDIGELIAGRIDSATGSLRLSAGLATQVKHVLTNEIEKVAPGFKKYLETYSRLSGPIDRLEILVKNLGGRNLDEVVNSLPMATERGVQQQLSQHKMRGAVSDIERDLAKRDYGGSPLAPRQQNILSSVVEDLTNQELAQRGGKMPGSDTYQNMATANLLTSIFGKQLAQSGIAKTLQRPVNFIYGPVEKRIRDLVDQAYLDPKLMAELLKISRTQRSVSLADIVNTANQNIYGGLIGGAAQ